MSLLNFSLHPSLRQQKYEYTHKNEKLVESADILALQQDNTN